MIECYNSKLADYLKIENDFVSKIQKNSLTRIAWDRIREVIAEDLLRSTEHLNQATYLTNTTDKLAVTLKTLKFKNLMSWFKQKNNLKKTDIVFWSTGYVNDDNGISVDRYFEQFHMDQKKFNVAYFDQNYGETAHGVFSKADKYCLAPCLAVSNILTIFIYPFLRLKNKKLISSFRERICTRFGRDVNLMKAIQISAAKYIADTYVYSPILDSISPKVVVYVTLNFPSSLIFLCKERGIKTVEYQHGLLNINYTHNSSTELLPDYLLLWSNIFSKKLLPKSVNKICVGTPRLDRYMLSESIDEKAIVLVVISQGSLLLEEMVLKALELNRDKLKIIFKPRPNEIIDWRICYPRIYGEYIRNQLIVCEDTQLLYHYLNQADYLLGISSALLYDGLAMGCSILVAEDQRWAPIENSIDAIYFEFVNLENIGTYPFKKTNQQIRKERIMQIKNSRIPFFKFIEGLSIDCCD